jgi:hypothetical protein
MFSFSGISRRGLSCLYIYHTVHNRRKKHGVDKILSEYELPEVVKKYFPGGWHLNDVEERPLFILRLGQMDVKGIIKVNTDFFEWEPGCCFSQKLV